MNYKVVTSWIIIGTVCLLVGYDGFALYRGGVDATISNVLITYSHKIIFIPFCFGVLIGHLFA